MNIKKKQEEALLRMRDQLIAEELVNNSSVFIDLPKDISDTAKKFNQIKPMTSLLHESKKMKYELSFHDDFKSFRCSGEHFANYLEKIDNGRHCNCIKEIASLVNAGGEVEASDLPFMLDYESLIINKRTKKILETGGVYENQRDGEIGKSAYIHPELQSFDRPNQNREIRIFFRKEEKHISIVLIDLYHLLATAATKEVKDKYKDVSKHNVCMTKLI